MNMKRMSKIGLGTWMLGGAVSPNENNDDERDIDSIKFAVSLGINHIDTSESYAGGKSEILVGRAIRNLDRSNIIVATKVREWNLEYEKLIESCNRSLERMMLQYIDLYYIHKQNPKISVKDTCDALNYLLSIGLIKRVGLSNVGINTIQEYNKYLEMPVFAVQNQYSLICRESQHKHVLEYCSKNDIKFVSWRPIHLSYPGSGKLDEITGRYSMLDEMAHKYNVSKAQIAAKWLLQQDNVHIVFKSNNPAHIQEIADTKNFELSVEDWKLINRDFPVQFSKGCSTNEFYELS